MWNIKNQDLKANVEKKKNLVCHDVPRAKLMKSFHNKINRTEKFT
jgi:hypothetical protein